MTSDCKFWVQYLQGGQKIHSNGCCNKQLKCVSVESSYILLHFPDLLKYWSYLDKTKILQTKFTSGDFLWRHQTVEILCNVRESVIMAVATSGSSLSESLLNLAIKNFFILLLIFSDFEILILFQQNQDASNKVQFWHSRRLFYSKGTKLTERK